MSAQQQAELRDIVWVDPGRMSGTPCFRGTRVPVQHLPDYLEENLTVDEFISDFPTVSRDQVIRFLEFAKQQLIECASS